MSRKVLQTLALALIFLFVGVATAAAGLSLIPNPGSPPSIFDDFQWSSTANGFWHVNPIGATAQIKNGVLTLDGHEIELDHRIQTDPYETVVAARIRAIHFRKFALGIGVYHAGTVSLEFDDDGAKCGRGSDPGWRIDYIKSWTKPPTNKWFYLVLSVKNPYPDVKDYNKASELADKLNNRKLVKPVTLTCSLYDSAGRLLGRKTPKSPPPNAHYVGFDEAYLRTWDSGNTYQLDWLYAGPPSGSPMKAIITRDTLKATVKHR